MVSGQVTIFLKSRKYLLQHRKTIATARETSNVNAIIEVIVEDVVWTGTNHTKITETFVAAQENKCHCTGNKYR